MIKVTRETYALIVTIAFVTNAGLTYVHNSLVLTLVGWGLLMTFFNANWHLKKKYYMIGDKK